VVWGGGGQDELFDDGLYWRSCWRDHLVSSHLIHRLALIKLPISIFFCRRRRRLFNCSVYFYSFHLGKQADVGLAHSLMLSSVNRNFLRLASVTSPAKDLADCSGSVIDSETQRH
jgi:hypothetical protein